MATCPLMVVWRVTEECNLGCSFCAYSRRLSRPRRVADPRQVLRLGALLGDHAASTHRPVRVSWMGGEPFLWPPLLETNRLFRHRFRLQTALTTNGMALESPALHKHLLGDFDDLTVSIDGAARFHDAYRGEPGLFGRLRSGLDALSREKAARGAGPLLRVNTILTRANVRSLEELCREMAECGVEELTFNALGGRERAGFYPEHRLRPEDVAWLRAELPGIRERARGLGLAVCGGERYLSHLALLAAGDPVPIAECRPGHDLLFVDPDGCVAPCGYTAQPLGVLAAELRSPADLQALPERFAERMRAHAVGACRCCAGTHLFGKFERE